MPDEPALPAAGDDAAAIGRPYTLKAVLFDFDGTLTHPSALDFAAIRRDLDCPADRPVLEFIAALPDAADRRAALHRLDEMELAAAARSRPNPGAETVLAYLKSHRIPMGIITRNTRASVRRALENFDAVGPADFAPIIARDSDVAPKPSPEGVLRAARTWGIPTAQVLVVGDYHFDIEAGREAGALTAFLDLGRGGTPPGSDAVLTSLPQLIDIVRMGRPLPPGKLPNDLLAAFVGRASRDDPSVLVHPGVGEDTAAVRADGAEVLVFTSDPITFASDAIGRYAVLVNANDMATSGATPRWLLTTLMLPEGISPAEVRHIMAELQAVSRECGVTLCGGHTEVTDAVVRPVVNGMLVGTVARDGLIRKDAIRPGDQVLLTKGVAVEGTAVIAREFSRQLRDLGLPEAAIHAGRAFIDRISILPEAAAAVACGGVSALHDVTEGGVATALAEMSQAGGHRITVDVDAIPVFPETGAICRLLGLDPLGLIGSGSLLICCRPETGGKMAAAVERAGVRVTRIGTVGDPGNGITAFADGVPTEWPVFEKDEIARLFGGRTGLGKC